MTSVTRNPHIINIWNVPFPSTFKLVIFLATYFQLIKFVSMNSKNVSNCNLQSDNSHNVHLCIFDVLCWSVPVFCVISILKSCLVTLTIILYPNVFFVMTCSLGVQRLFSSCVWSYALSIIRCSCQKLWISFWNKLFDLFEFDFVSPGRVYLLHSKNIECLIILGRVRLVRRLKIVPTEETFIKTSNHS